MTETPDLVDTFITGVPYCKSKSRGRLAATADWTAAVIEQTREMPKVVGACELSAAFVLPSDKFPADQPYGSDLDNLLKRLNDALNLTVFSDVPGHDGCIVRLLASKALAREGELTGCRVLIREVEDDQRRDFAPRIPVFGPPAS